MTIIGPSSGATVPRANGRIAFSSYGKIYTVQPDGSALTPVIRTLEDEKNDFAPAWSPDGGRIATHGRALVRDDAFPNGHWTDTDINLFLPDGTAFTRLDTPKQHGSGNPTW